MSELSSKWRDRLCRLSLPRSCALLAAAVALGYLAVAGPAYASHAAAGLAAAAVAAVVCWLASTAALVLAWTLRNTAWSAHGLLAGTLMRLLLPASVAGALHVQGGTLAGSGVFAYMLVFFLLTLVVETVLVLPVASSKASNCGSKWSSNISSK